MTTRRLGKFERAWRATICLCLLTLWMFNSLAYGAANFHGQVTFNGLPVPGATVIASQGDKKEATITDQQGNYVFTDLADGAWKLEVDMSGFETQTEDVSIADGTPGPAFDLKLLSLTEITHGAPPVQAENQLPPLPPANSGGNQNASAASAGSSGSAANGASATPNSAANSSAAPPAPTPNAPSPNNSRNSTNANNANNTPPAAAPPQATETGDASNNDLQQSAATGLVVNGSVNNGAASPFAQMAAFGNNRRGPGALYNGNVGVNFDTSAWDARSFSAGASSIAKPSYNQLSFYGNLGGPIGIPHHLVSQSQFFLGYTHIASDTASTEPGLVPTLLQRQGNFSQTFNALGQPVVVYNPATNTPFAADTVPVSSQAQALLNLYPMPNTTNVPGINYQTSGLTDQPTDSLQLRLSKNHNRNQFFGSFGFRKQSAQTDANIFGFHDSSSSQGIDTAVNWQRIYRPGGLGYFTTTVKYEFSRLSTHENPYFENRTNVSGNAGIEGNDQSALNWGPPTLQLESASPLSDPEYARNANETQNVNYQSLWYRGKHSLQFGGDVYRLQFNAFSQQDGRGTFAFNGNATSELNSSGQPVAGTGSDLADFLLGVPDTAELAFGNADKYLRGWRYDAFVNDDWRVKGGFTVDAGLRWEFGKPFTELKNRLVNLDVTPGFTAAAPVVASDPVGSLTGRTYSSSLLNSDFRGIEPRVAIAWRPRSNSPLVVRAGYGVSDLTSVYQVIAMQMAQQPPLSKTFDITNSAANPLTLATALNSPSGVPTFGVDPNFRIGYVQTWNASVQQDLPGSLVMTATYTGTKGTRLIQEFMPNMYPVGSTLAQACPSCPSDFVYLTSNGNSTRQAGSIQLRRRLRNGLTATLQYTYSKSIDDASSFTGAGITSSGGSLSSVQSSSSAGATSIAQDWRNLRAERGLSTFDQRNLMTLSVQYTTGEGLHAGALMSGWRGTLFKDWTFLSSLTVGSGLPLTPIYQSTVTGIQFPWSLRPDLTGQSIKAAPAGRHLNPNAFEAPANDGFGDAGRDSIIGPSQFSLNASFSRTFRLNNRMDATWQTDATNVLNTVTASSWNTIWGNNSAFGVTSNWNTMRKLSTTIRLRF
jgi:trimeric autotransporter adhesin